MLRASHRCQLNWDLGLPLPRPWRAVGSERVRYLERVGAAPMTSKARRRKLRRGAGAPSGSRPASPGLSAAGGATPQGRAPLPPGRPDAAALAAAVLGPLALYVATLPRTVVLEDDGLFLMAGVHLGVAHPPGYPIYTLIVHLFTRLPFGEPAFLGHLSSAVLGALACGAVFACARLLAASLVPALTAAWLYAVSEQFWSQAIITEVYTLNALLFFATWALVLLGARDPGRRWVLSCAAVTWGMGLANHWPLTVLATPGLALALLPAWREVLSRLPRLLGAAFVTAALPYAWMVWLSQQAPAISFYGPIDSLSELWFYVSRQGYSGVDVSPSAGWTDRAAFVGWFAADLARQTTLPGCALALLGLGALARAGGLETAAGAGSGLLALAGSSVVLIALLGFDFEPFRLAVFRPYPLIGYGVVALWAAVGLQWLIDRLPGWTAARWPARVPGAYHARRAAGAPAAMLIGATMVAGSASAGWPANDRSDGDFAERYAEAVFDLLPPDAVLFAFGDAIGPLGYYRFVEERRPDVALYSLQGLVLGNRLFDPLLPEEDRAAALGRFVDATDRAVFLLPDILPDDRGFGHRGFVLELLGEDTAGSINLGRDPRGERYFLELLDRQPSDTWERQQRANLLYHYGNYLGLLVAVDAPLLAPMAELLERAEACYPCLLGMAGPLLDNDVAGRADLIDAWLARAGALHDRALTKEQSAKLFFEQGRLAELTGDAVTAAARYRQAYALFPHPDRDAGPALRRLGLVP